MTVVEDLKLIPFKVSKEDAKDIIKQWVHGKSIDFENLVATYIPCWFVSCNVIATSEIALRQSTVVEGMLFEQQIDERYVIRERMQMAFKAIPYFAVSEAQSTALREISSFDRSESRSMLLEDLLGVEMASCELEDVAMNGWLTEILPHGIESFLKKRYQTYDEVLVQIEPLELGEVTAQQLLVPVWQMHYEHRNKAYRAWINGQTGQITGERPLGIKRFFRWKHSQKTNDLILPYLDHDTLRTLMHIEEDKGRQVTIVAR